MKVPLVLLVSLLVVSALCLGSTPNKSNHSSNETSVRPSGSLAQGITTFLSGARKDLENCNTTLRKPLSPGSGREYLNMTVLNGTALEMNGRVYRHVLLGIWNVSFSGEARLKDYKIVWAQRRNLTTTGGQEIDFKVYNGEDVVGSFTYWYVPFRLDSFCVVIDSTQLNLSNGDTLTFLFVHTRRGDMWLVLLG